MIEKIKKNLTKVIVLAVACLALIFTFILPGATMSTVSDGITVHGKISLLGVIFGNSEIVYDIFGINVKVPFSGGASVFGIISFLCLLAGIALIILSFFKKDKKFDVIGYILLFISGITFFMLFVAGGSASIDGTALGGEKIALSYKEFYDGCSLGVGAIINGIMLIGAFIFSIVAHFYNKKAKDNQQTTEEE